MTDTSKTKTEPEEQSTEKKSTLRTGIRAGSHEIVSPRDPASGLPTGKRM